MSFFEAVFLGVVQGLTEFFPVSSSGHLVLFQTLLGVDRDGGLAFEVAVHVATLVAIALFYHRRIAGLTVGVVRGEIIANQRGPSRSTIGGMLPSITAMTARRALSLP